MVYVAFKAVLVPPYGFHAAETSPLLTAAVKTGVAVGDEVTLIVRFQDIHDCVMHYPVGIERQNVDDSLFRLKDDFAVILRCVESAVDDGLSCPLQTLRRVQLEALNLFLS